MGIKITRMVPQTLVAHSVLCELDVDGEELPDDVPGRDENLWQLEIELETGRIVGWCAEDAWPKAVHLKVCDSGTYTLFDEGHNQLAKFQDYVPNAIVPGNYGDYVAFEITDDGFIKDWKKPSPKAIQEKFFKRESN